MVGSLTDARRAHDTLFRAVFETAQDAIGVSCLGVHRLVNEAYARMFRYAGPDELVGRPILDLIAPSARAAISERVRRRGSGVQEPNSYETLGLRCDGEEFLMDVRLSTYSLDGEPLTLAFFRDISEERRREGELVEARAFYQALFEVNTAVKLLVDPSTGLIMDANPAAAAFYGYSLSRLRGMPITHINTAASSDISGALGAAVGRSHSEFLFRHRLANGEVRDVEVHTGPFQHNGRTMLMSIIHDITDRVRLEEQVRQGQRMEAMGRLAGGLAHHFNNILTAVMGHAALAAGVEGTPDEARVHSEQVLAQARRATELTHQLLALSGHQVLHPSMLDLNRVISDMRPLIQRVAGRDVQVQMVLTQATQRVRADSGQLEQLLLNMVVRARDAMAGAGTLTVSTRRITAAGQPTHGGALPAGSWVVLSMEDTAPGMDDAARALVFEPFGGQAGLAQGLGLSTAYAVVQQSGGRMAVDRTPAGNVLVVYLPAPDDGFSVPPHTPAPMASTLVPGDQANAPTALVAEDHDVVRRLLTNALHTAGYQVLEASDGLAAVAAARAHPGPISIMVTDVLMPGLNGPEAAAQLLAERPDMRVLYISGYTEGLDLPLSSRATFLQKPFVTSVLLGRIKELLAS